MSMRPPAARMLALPENRSAFAALQATLAGLASDATTSAPQLLYVFGSSGSGKTCLIQTLTDELAALGKNATVVAARDFAECEALIERDLVIVEDLQQLPPRQAEALIHVLDERQRCDLPTVVTALQGPSELQHRGELYSRRLTSRLAGSLVVELQPLQAASRRRLLERFAKDAHLAVAADVLDWLAQQLVTGGRQLAGAIRQLKTLQALQKKPLSVENVRNRFETMHLTAERITDAVCQYYDVKPRQVLSARRSREVLLPRQLSMYLTRQLTNCSLERIGACFGGRDHKTVLHACQKMAQAVRSDAALAGVIRQLQASLA